MLAFAAVADVGFILLRGHQGVLVGEVEEAAGDLDGERLVAIERMEPDAGRAVVVVDVGADVQLQEPRDAGHGREAGGADALHVEGHDAKPSGARVGIDVQAGRELCLEHGHRHGPMEEEEAGPPLPHRGEAGRPFTDGQAVG
ncbi:hypothetical protein [Luteolibacter sp. LG18]|uniref:hypothetical protein n=1 Tax=Luteolibacter sp. LG18 TaxID=2819286 RepID=UPI002B2A97DE|nr:hypothetical protein llg_31970 [Luteolibacter sp. LG18]